MQVQLLPRSHSLRPNAEYLARAVYRNYYGAIISNFPSQLVGVIGVDNTVLCVAGLRTAASNFFSEQYLSLPIETALSAAVREPVMRDQIMEVTTLAGAHPGYANTLVNFILAHAAEQGFRWGLFTATRQLRAMFRRRGLMLIELAVARSECLVDSESWGSYYDSDPIVCAMAVQTDHSFVATINNHENHPILKYPTKALESISA